MKQDSKLRRSGAVIMANLVLLLGSLAYIMLLAVINGSVGFLCAMGVTLCGAVGVAKALGESIALSYGTIIALAIGCGVLRGILRFFEQYSNHYIAFRLLAVLRDKIFGALRALCPAKLESKQKGAIIAMITSDIETLEVFYAHTISPVCIAVLVSACVFCFVGVVSSWAIALVALLGYLTIGIVVPVIASGRLKASGVRYRAEFASFNAFFLDSIKGIKDIVLNNAGQQRETEVNARSEALLYRVQKDEARHHKNHRRDRTLRVCFYTGNACSRHLSCSKRSSFRRAHDHWRCRRVRLIRAGHCDLRPARQPDPDLCLGLIVC